MQKMPHMAAASQLPRAALALVAAELAAVGAVAGAVTAKAVCSGSGGSGGCAGAPPRPLSTFTLRLACRKSVEGCGRGGADR